ncbi:MAG: hypothetical protein ACE5FT_00210 [Candidatus Nanoarchaeia archaeon]
MTKLSKPPGKDTFHGLLERDQKGEVPYGQWAQRAFEKNRNLLMQVKLDLGWTTRLYKELHERRPYKGDTYTHEEIEGNNIIYHFATDVAAQMTRGLTQSDAISFVLKDYLSNKKGVLRRISQEGENSIDEVLGLDSLSQEAREGIQEYRRLTTPPARPSVHDTAGLNPDDYPGEVGETIRKYHQSKPPGPKLEDKVDEPDKDAVSVTGRLGLYFGA